MTVFSTGGTPTQYPAITLVNKDGSSYTPARGFRYRPGWFITTGIVSNSQALVAGSLYVQVHTFSESVTIDQVSMNVTTLSAGSTLRPVIYGSLENGAPGALIWQAASTLDSSTVGVKTLAIEPSVTIPAGTHWVGAQVLGGAPFVTMGLGSPGGLQPTLNLTFYAGSLVVTASGALPDPFPTTGLSVNNGSPRIGLRMA